MSNWNAVFTRSGKSYNPPVNSNDQQTNSENPINFDDSDEEDEEPTPQPKTQNPKPVKETTLPKPYKLKIPSNYEIVTKPFTCKPVADLGASINLMPYLLYAKLSFENLKPTKTSVRLAEKLFQCPVGIAENMLVEVGKFTFHADFVILDMEEDSKVPLVLRRPFIHIADAKILRPLLDEGSKILHSIERTLLEEEIFAEFDEFMAMTADENSDSEFDTEDPPIKKITINTDYKIKTSLEEPPMDLELKLLPDNLEYVFLEEPFFLPVIISSQLSKEKKNKLIYVLKKHQGKPLLENNRCSCIIYPIADSPWVRPIHCVQKKGRCKTSSRPKLGKNVNFMVKEGICAGHKVSNAGLKVDKAKINVISKLPPPTNIKGVRSFLGHAGFYRRFIKDFSKIARPITKLLEKDTPFEFDDECQKAFESLKEKLTCAPVIVSPNWNLPFELMCDASDFAVGAILGQKDGKNFHPIYFASKTLNSAQQKYTVTEKELMAVVFAFDKFIKRSYLILSKTIVHTDHSALQALIKSKSKTTPYRWI
ncbi:reverse transcriptase domain-containing protein [Tanacetum coccineum]